MIKTDLLITNADEIVTCGGPAPKIGSALNDLGIIKNGAIAIKHGKIFWVGEMADLPGELRSGSPEEINAAGKVIIPGFVDPHTHLVFGGSREEEYAMKLRGVPYLEILKNGGGILSTVEATRSILPMELQAQAQRRLDEMFASGTTTVEIKSGYGLSYHSELLLMGIINNLRVLNLKRGGIDIVPTFLGAHAWPKEMTREDYMLSLFRMLNFLAHARRGNLKEAEFCDVFCEEGAFSPEQSWEILEYARLHGMKLKIHAGEMNDLRGGELAARLDVTSLDHGENMSVDQVLMLAEKKIPVVLMPGVNFHLGTKPADARSLIEAGVPVALATDFNPGSSPILSMQLVMQIACRMYKMSPEEVINAATINAACAVDRADVVGSIEPGKQADLLLIDLPTYKQLPYWIGGNLAELVIKKGRIIT